jgi:transcription elongation factor GreB
VSKAFTRESDDAGGEDAPLFRPQLPPGTRNYITREGAEQLERRLNALREKKQAAASDSDVRTLEGAIRNLQQIVDSVVIAEVPADREKVAFGARVRVRHQNGHQETYRIVGIDESEPDKGLISWLSPLARALLSRRAGDKVSFKSPAGEDELEIMKVG